MARRAVIYRGEHAGANMIGYSNTPAVDREFQSYLPSLGMTKKSLAGTVECKILDYLTSSDQSVGSRATTYKLLPQ
jgi:hypothetical protein